MLSPRDDLVKSHGILASLDGLLDPGQFRKSSALRKAESNARARSGERPASQDGSRSGGLKVKVKAAKADRAVPEGRAVRPSRPRRASWRWRHGCGARQEGAAARAHRRVGHGQLHGLHRHRQRPQRPSGRRHRGEHPQGDEGARPVPAGSEGTGGGRWTLLDFGSIVVHVFYHPVREFYDLESLWIEAPRVQLDVPPEAPLRARRPVRRALTCRSHV